MISFFIVVDCQSFPPPSFLHVHFFTREFHQVLPEQAHQQVRPLPTHHCLVIVSMELMIDALAVPPF